MSSSFPQARYSPGIGDPGSLTSRRLGPGAGSGRGSERARATKKEELRKSPQSTFFKNHFLLLWLITGFPGCFSHSRFQRSPCQHGRAQPHRGPSAQPRIFPVGPEPMLLQTPAQLELLASWCEKLCENLLTTPHQLIQPEC